MMLVSMLPEAMNCESGDHPMHMVRAVWKRKSCFCCRWKERESRRESGRAGGRKGGGKGGRVGGRAGGGKGGREGGQEAVKGGRE